MKTLAIICARKGSQRLKDKHWLKIAGKPVWRYVVDSAVESRADVILLSTDDKKMRDESIFLGSIGGWVNRPREMASKTASIHRALQQAVEVFGHTDMNFIACLPANVPTVTPEVINRCIRALARDRRATAVMTMKKVDELPEWMWTRGKDGHLTRCQDIKKYRVQDFPERWIATGSCAVVRREVLMGCDSDDAFAWLGGHVIGVPDEPNAVEIHDIHDYKLAKALLEAKK